jgi:hypothetical protein
MDTDIDVLTKFMIRGQMMIASACPSLFLRKMLETNCAAEELQIDAFKPLLTIPYIKNLKGILRANAINAVSNLFEIPRRVMESFVEIALSPNLVHRKQALRELLVQL